MARTVRLMSPEEQTRLSGQPLTYAPVGATRDGPLPAGFFHLRRVSELGRGPDGDGLFDRAVGRLSTWRMHADAGLRVTAPGGPLRLGTVVRCMLGPLRIPCRVVWVLDEPDAWGFGYGTLPGHPETGEEAFVIRRAGGVVTFGVTAYSRPGTLATRLAGPVARGGQALAVSRYARALRD